MATAFLAPLPAYVKMFVFEFESSIAGIYVGEILAVAFVWTLCVVAALLLNSAKAPCDFLLALNLAIYSLPMAYFALYTCWTAAFDPNGCFGL